MDDDEQRTRILLNFYLAAKGFFFLFIIMLNIQIDVISVIDNDIVTYIIL